jgi:hypothetical protein
MRTYLDYFIVWLAKKPAVINTVNFLTKYKVFEWFETFVVNIIFFGIGMALTLFGFDKYPTWTIIPLFAGLILLTWLLSFWKGSTHG